MCAHGHVCRMQKKRKKRVESIKRQIERHGCLIYKEKERHTGGRDRQEGETDRRERHGTHRRERQTGGRDRQDGEAWDKREKKRSTDRGGEERMRRKRDRERDRQRGRREDEEREKEGGGGREERGGERERERKKERGTWCME